MERELKLGLYRHYKGSDKMYEVIGTAKSADDTRELVIYKSLYEGEFPYGQVWVRDKDEFLSKIPENRENPNNQEYRFEYIGEK